MRVPVLDKFVKWRMYGERLIRLIHHLFPMNTRLEKQILQLAGMYFDLFEINDLLIVAVQMATKGCGYLGIVCAWIKSAVDVSPLRQFLVPLSMVRVLCVESLRSRHTLLITVLIRVFF